MRNGKSDAVTASVPEGNTRWASHAVFGIVCALVIGVFAWFAEPEAHLGLKNPPAKDSAYNLLVQGFRAGQLNLKVEPPPGFARLADPYHLAPDSAYMKELTDMSYHQGKLYLYFGVTPVLVLFWPYAVLTGHYLPDTDAVVIFFGWGLIVAAGLMHAVWRRYFPEVNILVATVCLLGFALGTQKVLSIWCSVYEVAIVCGFAFTMLAIAAIWRALHEPERRVRWLLLASLAYGLAVGSRPSLLFGLIILLLPVAQTWRAATAERSGRRIGLLLAAAIGPVMLIGFGLMLYNFLRFGSPFEFGWHYQLNDAYQITAQQFSPRFLWFNFRFYFLEPTHWSSHYPFIKAVPLLPLPSGHYDVGGVYGGALTNYPLLWLALATPLAWQGRPWEAVSGLRWFVAAAFLLFVTCALTLCLFHTASNRYDFDFLPALMLLAVTGVFGLERALVARPVWRRVARWSWCLLLAYSVVFNLLAGVQAYAEARRLIGNALLNQGRVDEAIMQYQKTLALWPESAIARAGLGNAFMKKQQLDEAIIQFQKALKLQPELPDAHVYLGDAFLQKGLVNEAITQFQKALNLKPDFAEAHNLLGYSLLRVGRVNDAIPQFQLALEIKPDFAAARNNLGGSLLQIGQADAAIAQFQRALDDEQNYSVYYNLGRAFYLKRMTTEALANYQKAIGLQPLFIPAQRDLAWMLATWPEPSVRNGDKAVALAVQANQLSEGKDPRVLRALAAAYAETGRFPQALATARQALELEQARSPSTLTNELQSEIELYQNNSPCRSTNN